MYTSRSARRRVLMSAKTFLPGGEAPCSPIRKSPTLHEFDVPSKTYTLFTANMSIEEELQEPLLERLSATPQPGNSSTKLQKSSKRKREADLPESKKTAKKPKNRKKKAIDEDDDELNTEAGINKAFSHMDSNLLADYIAQRTRKYESELSSIELDDRYLPGVY